MRKRYVIKVYEIDGTFIRTLDPKLLMNEVSFNMQTNGGQGQCRIDLNLPLDDFEEGSLVNHMNIVEILESDDVFSPTPRLIYTGFVSQYVPSVQNGKESVSLTLLGLVSMLSLGYYKSGSSYTFNKTADPAVIIEDIIDRFAAVYTGGWVSYSGGHVDTVGTTINYDVDKLKWLDALKKIAAFAEDDWWWYVDEEGQVHLEDRPATATHLLTIGKDVDALTITKNNEKVVNKYRLSWGSVPTTSVYEDATSQSTYGLREKLETDSATKNSTSADQKGNKLIADYKDAKVEVSLRVNSNYDIESIKPGHTVTIRNTKAGSGVLPANLLVTAVQYTPTTVTLTLENTLASLASTFVDAVETVG